MKIYRSPNGTGTSEAEFICDVDDDIAFRFMEKVNSYEDGFTYWGEPDQEEMFTAEFIEGADIISRRHFATEQEARDFAVIDLGLMPGYSLEPFLAGEIVSWATERDLIQLIKGE